MYDDTVGIDAVEGGAAIAMNFKWVDYGNAGTTELFFKLLNALDTLDNEAEMVQVLLGCGRGEARRHLMQRNVVVAGREIYVFWVWFPNHIHAEQIFIKALRLRHISDFKRDVAHPFDTAEWTHGSNI